MNTTKWQLVARGGLVVGTLLAVAASCSAPDGAGPDGQSPVNTRAVDATQVQNALATAQAITPPAQGNFNLTPSALPTQVSGLATTAANTAPTVAALASQVATLTLVPVSSADATTVMSTYAREVLGIAPTIVQAGGADTELTRQLNLSEAGTTAQNATAQVALESYAALFTNGAGSVSYGSGTVAGDVSVDINASSLGAFSLMGGPNMPGAEAEALALALQTYPALNSRVFSAQTVAQGYAWLAEGQTSGFDVQTRQATLVAERVLLGVAPVGRRAVVIYVVVGKGDFAANVQP